MSTAKPYLVRFRRVSEFSIRLEADGEDAAIAAAQTLFEHSIQRFELEHSTTVDWDAEEVRLGQLKTYHVRLYSKGHYDGEVEATSVEDAEKQAFLIWTTADPHPFEQVDDELMSVEVEED